MHPYREGTGPTMPEGWRLRRAIRIAKGLVLHATTGAVGAGLVALFMGAGCEKRCEPCETCVPPVVCSKPTCKNTLFINPPAGATIRCDDGSEPIIVGASVKCLCPSATPPASASAPVEKP